MNHKIELGVDKFLIKWKGWGSQNNSWEPLGNLGNNASELHSAVLNISLIVPLYFYSHYEIDSNALHELPRGGIKGNGEEKIQQQDQEKEDKQWKGYPPGAFRNRFFPLISLCIGESFAVVSFWN